LLENEEVIVELSSLNVHDVVGHVGELLDGCLEFGEDLEDRVGQGLTLGVSDVDVLQLVEHDDGVSQVPNVLASLRKGVQSHEESVGGDLPGVLGLGFVLKVGFLELGAHIMGQLQLVVSLLWLLSLDVAEDLLTVDRKSAGSDDCVADLSDEHNKSGGSVVVLRVVPDQEDGVHDWDEELRDLV
jgi:hypothetical protein